jgi:DNA-binding MarR family transcriptional regulator
VSGEVAEASTTDALRLWLLRLSLTNMVERLEREGLILHRQRPEDRRSLVVRLTDAGREIFEKMARDFEGRVASMLSELDEEVERLAELLGKAGRSVRNINGEETV